MTRTERYLAGLTVTGLLAAAAAAWVLWAMVTQPVALVQAFGGF
jgi:hypothetical protein